MVPKIEYDIFSFWGIVFYIRNIILGLTTKKRYSHTHSSELNCWKPHPPLPLILPTPPPNIRYPSTILRYHIMGIFNIRRWGGGLYEGEEIKMQAKDKDADRSRSRKKGASRAKSKSRSWVAIEELNPKWGLGFRV